MKTTGINGNTGLLMAILTIAGMIFFFSCEKENYNNFGFESGFDRHSNGLNLMDVGAQTKSIQLSGNIFMNSGDLHVEFTDPDGFIVYTMYFPAPGNYEVNETFKAVRGIWRLRYHSLEGQGSIDLHAVFR